MKVIYGKATAFSSRPWDMDGRTGITRNLSVSHGEESDKVKITDELWNRLAADQRQFIEGAGGSTFGSEIVAIVRSGFQGKGLVTDAISVIAPDGTVVVNLAALPDEAVLALQKIVPARTKG